MENFFDINHLDISPEITNDEIIITFAGGIECTKGELNIGCDLYQINYNSSNQSISNFRRLTYNNNVGESFPIYQKDFILYNHFSYNNGAQTQNIYVKVPFLGNQKEYLENQKSKNPVGLKKGGVVKKFSPIARPQKFKGIF